MITKHFSWDEILQYVVTVNVQQNKKLYLLKHIRETKVLLHDLLIALAYQAALRFGYR